MCDEVIEPPFAALPTQLAPPQLCFLRPSVSRTQLAGFSGFVRQGSARYPRAARPSLPLREHGCTVRVPLRSCGSRNGGCRAGTNFPQAPATVVDEVDLSRSNAQPRGQPRAVLRT